MSYRKIYGLTSYIGLADRDRFELSGRDLEDWLENPSSAKEILLRNQIEGEVEAGRVDELARISEKSSEGAGETEANPGAIRQSVRGRLASPISKRDYQGNLFDRAETIDETLPAEIQAKEIAVRIHLIDGPQLSEIPLSSVVTGLGFEDRALAANEFLAKWSISGSVVAVRYRAEGNARKILDLWEHRGTKVYEVTYEGGETNFPILHGLNLVDVSGLTKPLIFRLIKDQLVSNERLLVCHAAAERNYPLQEDLERLFAAEKSDDPMKFLERLSEVLTGEKGPYTATKLLDEPSDPSRSRALFAFSSPKHERLFSLLDRREFDYIEVIAPDKDTPRARVCIFSGGTSSCKNYPNARMARIDTDDLEGIVSYLDRQYLSVYGSGGANVEVGLTGSKTQAVASAILAARRKIAQAWYLGPKEFDEKRFSTGAGKVRIFDISVSDRLDSEPGEPRTRTS